ncbi:hypothetical protein SUBVAR_07430 [Subdoligranulum variabile DSM 15176]|uniref:Uncharacterized protein n=1 Tax=Subdoligranulum variabile DSM 15176 TaxID=411471 RepID=D1PSP6_9FIRM|nr:hypothetical protein SUBVAR_07430 [Subdoligranulum variabile DSM 15176]
MFLLCKEGTEEIPIKNAWEGNTLPGIFDWNFFGSFFAKKEQKPRHKSIAPVRLRLRAGAWGIGLV